MTDWRERSGNLADIIKKLYRGPADVRDSFTDLTILLPDNSEMRAHKMILALASPYFEAKFYGPWAEKNPDTFKVTETEVDADTFRTVISFIYSSGDIDGIVDHTGDIDKDVDDYWRLLEAGHIFILEGLIDHCHGEFKKYIKTMDSPEAQIEFTNKAAADLSIYDHLMELGAEDMMKNLPQFILDGYRDSEITYIEELRKPALECLKKKLNSEETHWNGSILSCWSILWELHEHRFELKFEGIAQKCRDQIKAYLMKNGKKERLIEFIVDLFDECLDDFHEDYYDTRVLYELRKHLQGQSWEKMCDNVLMDSLLFVKEWTGFDILVESTRAAIRKERFFFLEGPGIDWSDPNDLVLDYTFYDDGTYWAVLKFAREQSLPKLVEHCRRQIIELLISPQLYGRYHDVPTLYYHITKATEAPEDEDIFKLGISLLLKDKWKVYWEHFNNDESWLKMNEKAVRGIYEMYKSSKGLEHIKRRDVIKNISSWCKHHTASKKESLMKFKEITGY